MVYAVVVVHYYLIETALYGMPCLINLVPGSAMLTDSINSFIFWSSIIETLDVTEKAQIQKVYVR